MNIEFTGNKANPFTYTEGFKCRMITLETTMYEQEYKFNNGRLEETTGTPLQVRVTFTQINNPKRNHKGYSVQLKYEDRRTVSVVDKFGNQHMSGANWETYNTSSGKNRLFNADCMNELYKQALSEGFKVVADNTYLGFNPYPQGIVFPCNVEDTPSVPNCEVVTDWYKD